MSLSLSDAVAIDARCAIKAYAKVPVLFERGEGVYLFDADGKRYLDFFGGIAVCGLGHSHPKWVKAVQDQAAKLVHVSNLFYTEPQAKLLAKLAQVTRMDRAFICNSGTEANECAIKIARKWGKSKRGDSCHRVIGFARGFHGRTLGSLSLTANPKYQAPFTPLVPGMKTLEIHDHAALDRELDGTVCAVLIEPVQGEGGVWPTDPRCLQGLRKLCDERGVLLIFDEVQSGIGRTGAWLDCHHAGVLPDLAALAKGLGGGFPIGACVARGEAAEVIEPGEHGSTYSGNPLACAAALAVLDTIEEDDLLGNARETGAYLRSALEGLVANNPDLLDHVRGRGLMLAIEFKQPQAKQVARAALERGLVCAATGDTTLRIVPPLVLTPRDVDEGTKILGEALASIAVPA